MLKESFGTPNGVERHKTFCSIFNSHMREGASVTDHVLYMIEQIDRLSKLGYPLHVQLEKDSILNLLSKSYLTFLCHYRMTKPAVSYHGLLGLLQTYEKDHQLNKRMVNVVGRTSAERFSFKKEKRKVQKKAGAGVPKIYQSKKVKTDKSKTEYFFYKKLCHWKQNYPAYIATIDPNRLKKKK